jgi:acyl-CoA hydrolase
MIPPMVEIDSGNHPTERGMNLSHATSFIVMPDQTNYLRTASGDGMIFGGAFMAELDKAAAACVGRLLHDSECDSAVTFKVLDGIFYAPAQCGDLIFLNAKVIELRNKSVTVQVEAYRERRAKKGQDKIAKFTFVFVTKKGEQFHAHGLKLPE